MKNIFKLMGLALIAGSMFVACSKDDENNDKIQVTFGGESWSCNEEMELDGQEFAIYKDADAKISTIVFACPLQVANTNLNPMTAYVMYTAADGNYKKYRDGYINITAINMENPRTISGEINTEIALEQGENYKPLNVTMNDADWDYITK